MNEQIKELADRATTYIEPTETSGEGWIFDKEKFAELIVKECANVAADHDALDIYEEIREHFGVEE
jgi:predicted nucleotide-binding protein (sugar kinase/HSP70/actin superfamily)